jgi:phytoene dehydrogenase-like protein
MGCFVFPVAAVVSRNHRPIRKNESMNQLPLFDVAVIGGGLAGLTAAIYAARAGRSVIVFEKSPQAGGRASTQNIEGFHFNQGPHALYRGGHGIPILREMGIHYEGAQASYEGSWAVRGGEKHPLPGTPEALLSTPLLADESRQEAIALFGSLDQIETAQWYDVSLRQWLDTQIRHEDVRDLFEGLFRLATYCADVELQSAGAALDQMIMARQGVDYLDCGWQSLVDRMREDALAAGVRIETRSPVEGLHHEEGNAAIELASGDWYSARSVISTVGPSFIMRLVNDGTVPSLRQWADEAMPIHAACLDIALRRLPNPEHQFAIGLDRSLYYSVHTRSAKLAPANGAVIQLAKYLHTDSTQKGSDVRTELEAVMDWLQPGWREELVSDRFLPRMLVSNAVVTAVSSGTPGRPSSTVPEIPNLFLAGDWVGPHGMLVDASLSSARDAAKLALRWLDSAKIVPQTNLTTA